MQSSAALIESAKREIAKDDETPAIIKVGKEICARINQIACEQGLYKEIFWGWGKKKLSLKPHPHKSLLKDLGLSWEIDTNICSLWRIKKDSLYHLTTSITSGFNRGDPYSVGDTIKITYPHPDKTQSNLLQTEAVSTFNLSKEEIAEKVAKIVIREALRNGWKTNPSAPSV